MNKEEILARSRKENKTMGEERDRSVAEYAGRVAMAFGGLVCMAIILLEMILSDSVSLSIWAVYFSMSGTMALIECIRLGRKYRIVFAVLELLLAAVFLALHIAKLVG